MPSYTNLPKYSVIVATYNRCELLRECLESLALQSISKLEYEIIIINDGSTDDTENLLIEFAKNNPELKFRVFNQKNCGPAKARNVGIFNSLGDILFFTDDDCVVPKNWIQSISEGYDRHSDVIGVGGWYVYEGEKLKSMYVTYTTYCSLRTWRNMYKEEIKTDQFLQTPAGNTSNMSYRKSILLKMGGFDETLEFVGYVDWELKKRIMDSGHSLLYIPFHVLHNKPLSTKEIIRKFFNRGRGAFHLTNKNPELYINYYPSINKFLSMKRIGKSEEMQFVAFFEFVFSQIGWHYQKAIEKHLTR